MQIKDKVYWDMPYESACEEGKIVHIIPKKVVPKKNTIIKFYGITEQSQYFKGVSKALLFTRYVIQKNNGYYIIFPEPSFKNFNVRRTK